MAHMIKDAEKLAVRAATAPVRDYYEAKGFWKGVRAALPVALLVTVAGAVALRHLAPQLKKDGEGCPVCRTVKDAMSSVAQDLKSQFDKATSPEAPAPQAPVAEEAPATQA